MIKQELKPVSGCGNPVVFQFVPAGGQSAFTALIILMLWRFLILTKIIFLIIVHFCDHLKNEIKRAPETGERH